MKIKIKKIRNQEKVKNERKWKEKKSFEDIKSYEVKCIVLPFNFVSLYPTSIK